MTETPSVAMSPRVALITGAFGGIGSAIARRLAAQRFDLGLLDKAPPPSDLIDDLAAFEVRVHCLAGDVGDASEVQASVRELRAAFGPVTALINNAGITANIAPLERMDEAAWQRELATNLTGPLYLAQAVLPDMVAAGWGRIVNVSSMAARGGLALQTGYAMTKTGLLGLNRNLALEYARHGITSNAVLPGLIETEAVRRMPAAVRDDAVSMVPARRLGQPEEVAALVGFLCSNEASFVNGAEIDVGGGAHLSPVVLGSQRLIAERQRLALRRDAV
ncbi:MAG: SDR family NAD(P)-dependent oxidoreductase [Xanthobacteraceae bacterium]